jgi:4-phosphopantoate--beta-alanine ligase
LNPMSRTAVHSDITIVDNIIRALPLMVEQAREMKDLPKDELRQIVESFDNTENLATSVHIIMQHLEARANDIGNLRKKFNIGVIEK